MHRPKITVAMPTLGRNTVLIDSIKDVLDQSMEDFELLVIDQSISHDKQTTDFLLSLKDERFHYFLVGPPSLPAARNFAISMASAEVILFIDDDVRLPTDFLQQHLRTYAEHPDITAVAGRVKQDGVPFTHTLAHFDKYRFQVDWFNCPDPQYAEGFPGGNFSIKTAALKDVGGFDSSYRLNALREESDCAFRVRQKGYKIFFNPEAYIFHLAAPTGGSRIKVHQYNNLEFYKNDLLFTLKTVSRSLLVPALAYKYGRYVWTTYQQRRKLLAPLLFGLRNLYFAIGLTVAIKRYLVPLSITQEEVRA